MQTKSKAGYNPQRCIGSELDTQWYPYKLGTNNVSGPVEFASPPAATALSAAQHILLNFIVKRSFAGSPACQPSLRFHGSGDHPI